MFILTRISSLNCDFVVIFCVHALCVTHCAFSVFVFDVFDFAWDNMLMGEQNGAVDSTTESNVALWYVIMCVNCAFERIRLSKIVGEPRMQT